MCDPHDKLRSSSWNHRLDTETALKLLTGHGYFESRSAAISCVAEMYRTVIDLENAHELFNMVVPNDVAAVKAVLGPLASIDMRRPAGRYCLDLSNRYQHNVAQRLYEEAQRQSAALIRSGRRDVSQRGDTVCWRNITMDNQPFELPIKAWDLPEVSSVLAFDLSPFDDPRKDLRELDSFVQELVPLFRQQVTSVVPGIEQGSWQRMLRSFDGRITVAMLKQLMLLLPRYACTPFECTLSDAFCCAVKQIGLSVW